MSKRVGVYPGTFDPITHGHYDIIRRALHVVDHLVIGVARNDAKGPMFSTDERVEIVRDEMNHLENGGDDRIEVRPFDTLLMHFAESVGAGTIDVEAALEALSRLGLAAEPDEAAEPAVIPHPARPAEPAQAARSRSRAGLNAAGGGDANSGAAPKQKPARKRSA